MSAVNPQRSEGFPEAEFISAEDFKFKGAPGEWDIRWGSLHHLASGDQVSYMGVQYFDFRHMPPPVVERPDAGSPA